MRKRIRFALTNRYGAPLDKRIQFAFREQFAYGHREILLKYAQLESDQIFKAVISHGDNYPVYAQHIKPEFDVYGNPLLQLKWRSDAELNASNMGIRNVKAIGAIGIYQLLNDGVALSALDTNLKTFSREYYWSNDVNEQLRIIADYAKVLYFPQHSWEGDVFRHHLDLDFPLLKLAKTHVTVCLNYFDFSSPRVRNSYLNHGFQVTCVGTRDSVIPMSPVGGRTEFLSELFKIIQEADLVISNEITTALFYAALLQKPCGIIKSESSPQLEYSHWRSFDDYLELHRKIRAHYPWLWGDSIDQESIERELRALLGLESIKSPNFFKYEVETFSEKSWVW